MEFDGDDAVDQANQHTEQDACDGTDGQRNAPAKGHQDHHIRSEGERAAHGKVDLARDHQHDFGHGDQAKPARVAEDDTQLLRRQENPVAAELEVDDEYQRDDSYAGLPIAGKDDQYSLQCRVRYLDANLVARRCVAGLASLPHMCFFTQISCARDPWLTTGHGARFAHPFRRCLARR